MAVLLGLAAAIGFGGADFLGGSAARRSRELSILVVVQVVGVAVAVGLAAAEGSPLPPDDAMALAALAGVSGVTGLGLLYRALATGRMGVAAPVSAVISSVLAVAWGFGRGERPSGPATVGIVLAVAAVVLVARSEHTPEGREPLRPLLLATAAGVLFGVTIVAFAESAEDAGMWPLVMARVAAGPVVLAAVLLTRAPFLPHRGDRPAALGSALLDVTGNAALVAAFQRGLTSLVAPIATLYPAVTVGLARVVLAEKISRRQMVGVVLALAGLVLIAA